MIFTNELPSRMYTYPATELDVQPFKPRQIALMSKAVMLESMAPTIEAMGQCISNIDINRLTIGDFFYLLTWQRINAFSHNKPHVIWDCTNQLITDGDKVFTPAELTRYVEAYENASEEERKGMEDPNETMIDVLPCGHVNHTELTIESFSVRHILEEPLDARLDFPRCKDLVELTELRSDPDYGPIVDLAVWIKGDDSLVNRIQSILDSEDMELMELAAAANRDRTFGIMRRITSKCERCGQSQEHEVIIDARSFLL
jgi:hypothetical protein